MHYTIEDHTGLKRRMTYSIPEERIYQAVQQRLREVAHTVKIDGYRPGKAPLSVVDMKLGDSIRQEVISELLLSTFYEAIAQEQLKLASSPIIHWNETTFEAEFEVYPEFELASLDSIIIENPVVDIQESDIDAMLEALQRLNMEWIKVERPASTGDRLIVNMQGYMDGEAMREIRHIPFILGQPVSIQAFGTAVQEEFARQLEGVMPGRFVELDIGFPEKYPMEHLAGQTVHFTLHVCSVEAPHLPKLDDHLARKAGITEGGYAALREQTRTLMETGVRQKLDSELKNNILDALLETHKLDLPESRIAAESSRLLNNLKNEINTRNMTEKEREIAALMVDDQARRNIALGLILAKIARENGLEIPEEALSQALEAWASEQQTPTEARAWLLLNPDLMPELETRLLEDAVIDWIKQKIKLVDKAVKFSAVMPDGR